jgi:hypothetical protein
MNFLIERPRKRERPKDQKTTKMTSKSILLPISLGLNYQHHPDLYAILELSACADEIGKESGIDAPKTRRSISEHDTRKENNPLSIGAEQLDVISSSYYTENALCLLNIPDIFIPKDILLYFQHSLSNIVLFRIYRHFLNHNEYILLLFFTNPIEKLKFYSQYQNKQISSLYDVQCQFHEIKSISVQTFYEYFSLSLPIQLFYLLYNYDHTSNELIQLISSAIPSSAHSPHYHYPPFLTSAGNNTANNGIITGRSVTATPVGMLHNVPPSPSFEMSSSTGFDFCSSSTAVAVPLQNNHNNNNHGKATATHRKSPTHNPISPLPPGSPPLLHRKKSHDHFPAPVPLHNNKLLVSC